jgi:hypothetical protein
MRQHASKENKANISLGSQYPLRHRVEAMTQDERIARLKQVFDEMDLRTVSSN